jgi:hypothetical protein
MPITYSTARNHSSWLEENNHDILIRSEQLRIQSLSGRLNRAHSLKRRARYGQQIKAARVRLLVLKMTQPQ